MITNQKNYVSIDKIESAVFREVMPENSYFSYSKGRGICGIALVLDGKAIYTFDDGSSRELVAGEAALFSNKISYIFTPKGKKPFSHYIINFSLTEGYSFPSDFLIKPVDIVSFEKKCNHLIELWNSGNPTALLRCTAVLYDLIADVLEQNISEKVGFKSYQRVIPAIHYIDTNYSQSITLDFLAKLCAMSQTSFRRVFSTVCGISPIQYLLDVRIKHALEYLDEGTLTVAEISSLCGFKDVEHFCRTFKKRVGVTPTHAFPHKESLL